ncbi:GNAT family N-acetyltransferase [Reyranella sp.]|uniref:GNAT family N-acetyltransferase n=1 Tax=Reyranella sp. TaxID=1929291 RepID=UPI002730B578|nr:GNAT family N-acetyltransferase [Reyranella sp.]MDP2374123.1 GNAT family N-acetyltransferase [Reyranella sp.]
MPKAIPELFAHQPPPRADGRLPITITYLEIAPADWTRRGLLPALEVSIERVNSPTVALYRDLYDRVGRPWLWYERRLLSDQALAALMAAPGHELHIAREGGALVGYFELLDDEIVFFGLTLGYVGRRIGPWLLDRAIERAFARGTTCVILNTNTLDHPKALDTYRKAGFQPVRSETKELQDPRVLWPEVYRWPPA